MNNDKLILLFPYLTNITIYIYNGFTFPFIPKDVFYANVEACIVAFTILCFVGLLIFLAPFHNNVFQVYYFSKGSSRISYLFIYIIIVILGTIISLFFFILIGPILFVLCLLFIFIASFAFIVYLITSIVIYGIVGFKWLCNKPIDYELLSFLDRKDGRIVLTEIKRET